MLCKIDDKEIDCRKLIYRDLGYGSPSKFPPVRIELVIPLSELKTKFGPPLKSFVEQCKIDDLESQEGDIPELAELNYPTIGFLLDNNPALISKLIEKYMYFDLLDAFFYENPRNMWSIAINSIDSAVISDEALVVVGRGYEFTELAPIV